MTILTERQMEEYLRDGAIYDSEGNIDSSEVIEVAISKGFVPYLLDGQGDLHDTYIFVRK